MEPRNLAACPALHGEKIIMQGGVRRLELEEQTAASCTLVYQQLTAAESVGT